MHSTPADIAAAVQCGDYLSACHWISDGVFNRLGKAHDRDRFLAALQAAADELLAIGLAVAELPATPPPSAGR